MALFAEDSFDLPTDPRVIDPGGAPLPPVRRPDRDAAEEQGQNSTPPAVDSLILNSPQRPALTLVPPEPASVQVEQVDTPAATAATPAENRPNLSAVPDTAAREAAHDAEIGRAHV